MRLLVGLIAGFMLGAIMHGYAVEKERLANARTLSERITDDIDWLSEFLLTDVPDPTQYTPIPGYDGLRLATPRRN